MYNGICIYGIANKDNEATPFLIIHVTFNISAFVIYKRLISVAAVERSNVKKLNATISLCLSKYL